MYLYEVTGANGPAKSEVLLCPTGQLVHDKPSWNRDRNDFAKL